MTFSDEGALYRAQDQVLRLIQGRPGLLGRALLCGGTALARLYLHHRVSWDLDFFLPEPFDPSRLERELRAAGVAFVTSATVPTGRHAAQLHGHVEIGDQLLKVSFIEDVFAGMFDEVVVEGIRTETIEGLYHRKLRTLSGTAGTVNEVGATAAIGGRQRARDLLDLYVLDREVCPIPEFIADINRHGANFPLRGFISGIRAIRWMELVDEFGELVVAPRYREACSVGLKKHFDALLPRLERVAERMG